MPQVKIDWNAGRTDEQKNQIAEVITKALVEIGNAPEENVGIEFIDHEIG
jgi:4-oxalocrotonate tautomerase family enzyme